MSTNGIDPGFRSPMASGTPTYHLDEGGAISVRQRERGIDELRRRMQANYVSPGLHGESMRDRLETVYTSDRVPRRDLALEDGGAIPDTQGVPADQGINVGDGGTQDTMSAVKDTLDFTRRKFMGQAFGQHDDQPPALDLRHLQTQPHMDDGGVIPEDTPEDDEGSFMLGPRGGALDVGAALSEFPSNAKRVGSYLTDPRSSQDVQRAVNPATVPENAKAMWAYLTGASAASPEAVASAEKKVDPGDEMDPNDRKFKTVASVKQEDGPEAASGILQHYRQRYDHFKAFAGAAAAKGNIVSATDAATQAFTNLPDGHKIVFEPNDEKDGVVAHVQGADGNKAGSLKLSLNQFSNFIRGNASLFDNLMDAGSTNALRKVFTEAKAANKPESIVSQLAKELGVSRDDVIRLYPSPQEQMKLLQQHKQQERVNTINETKAKNPLGIQQMKNDSAQAVANTRGTTARDVQQMKSDSWAKVYDLKDRNDQHRILAQAMLRQQSDVGRNTIKLASGMLAQGRSMSDIDKVFKEKGVDLGQLMGVPKIPTVAAPTNASTTIQQPGATRKVRLPNGQVVDVPAQ